MPINELKAFRVLLVEDQMIVAMQIEDMLRAAGCEVVGPVGTLQQRSRWRTRRRSGRSKLTARCARASR
jgi:AmiR/NasT family two-component response regulator